MSQNAVTKKQTVNSKYLLDFYIKDFKYISPEALGVHNVHKNGGVKGWTYKEVGRIWAVQVVRGLKQLFTQGSLHGVKYMLDPSFSRAERLTWVAIMIISVAACAGNITQLFLKWTSTPFVNVIDSLPSPVWAVPFPNVVLCPHLHVKMSYKHVNRFDDLEKFFASLVCPQMSKKNPALKESMTPHQNQLLEKFILQAAPKCTEVIKSCYWRPSSQTWLTEECCTKLFSPVFTNYGLCFAFNSLPLHGMTNITTAWQRTFSPSVSQKTLDWGLDAGYPKVFPPDPAMEPFRVMASGETNGLGVELYLNNSEHQVACDGASVGFNMIISSPTNHVYTSTIIRLPMDRMTTVEVYPITYRTDSSLRALLPERRQCFFQDERKLEYFEFYTDSNCKLDLLIREARKSCNCVYYNWPKKSPKEPICSTKLDLLCINDVKAKVEEQLIYAYFADSEEQRKPTGQSSSCHPACNDVIYNSQVFYSDLKADPTESPKWGHPGLGEITRLNVHFYDDIFLGQHRHAQYDDYYFVAPAGFKNLRCMNEALSAKVLEQVANNQELVTLNDFEHQSSEYQLRKCLQERISDLESWRWVHHDLANRLEEVIQTLQYERRALHAVVERVKEEIKRHSEEGSRPGALTPQSDPVEEAILMEYRFLREQLAKLEGMLKELDEQIPEIEKDKKRLEVAASNKEETIHIDEKLPDLDISSRLPTNGVKKKSLSPVGRWEGQCYALKRKGLCALSHALTIRQQVRGCRHLLSVTAQSHATRVDSLLRRRLYLNTRKLEDLQWQKGEAQNDLECLSNELTTTEQNVLETMDKVRLMEARLADRRLRPPKELTKDSVDRKLKDELGRLKQYLKHLRNSIDRITSLQADLKVSITQINCLEEEISQVVQLDEARMNSRSCDDDAPAPGSSRNASNADETAGNSRSKEARNVDFRDSIPLSTIKEEEEFEEEDVPYPFDF